MRPAHTPQFMGRSGKYLVDDVSYQHLNSVYRAARERGYAGSNTTIYTRLNGGATTWAALLAPRPGAEKNSEAAKRTHQRKRDEMAAVIAALDARKAGLA